MMPFTMCAAKIAKNEEDPLCFENKNKSDLVIGTIRYYSG